MKRLFPRAVPETLVALMFLGGACEPNNSVKSGAPVLNSFSYIDPNGNHLFDVGPTTPNCAPGSAEGMDCDPGTAVCELDAGIVCLCNAKDMCDPSIMPDAAVTGGTLSCSFPAAARLVATFDRLLDTAPFAQMKTVASMNVTPPGATDGGTDGGGTDGGGTDSGGTDGGGTDGAATDGGGIDGGGIDGGEDGGGADGGAPMPTVVTAYNSAGAPAGLIFPLFGNPAGPSITVTSDPAFPTSSTISIALLKDFVQAQDGKTPFTGQNLLADGKIAVKTLPFAIASLSTPTPPPPDMSGMMMMGCPGMNGGNDGGEDGGGIDGGQDGGVADAGTADAGAADAGIADAGDAGDACATCVTADMNMQPIMIVFTNFVGMDVTTHITMTEDGQAFTDFAAGPPPGGSFPSATVAVAPNTMWAPNKTYAITVDMDTADVLGATLGAPQTATFTMGPAK
jgi:hypothetical protein